MDTTVNTPAIASTTKTTKRPAKRKTAPVSRSRERDNTQIPGYELIKRMKERLLESGENSETRMIECLGLTRQYWNSFCNGHRPVETLIRNKDRLFWIADFLGCSALDVRVWAGDVSVEELWSNKANPLWLEVQKLQQDPRWKMLAPQTESEWNELPSKTKLLIVGLYRTLTETDIKREVKKKNTKPTTTVESL